MTDLEEREIALAEERWAHEVEEELIEEVSLEENFQECLRKESPAKRNVEDVVLV
jgi:hypothetical protein